MKTSETTKTDVSELTTVKLQMVGQIKALRAADSKILGTHKTVRLDMINKLVDISDTAEKLGVKLSHQEIAHAYEVSRPFITRSFIVARDAEKCSAYIAGRISITGNLLTARNDKEKVKLAHKQLVDDGKKATVKSLAEESGCSIDICQMYLSAYLGKSLHETAHEAGNWIKKTLDFQTVKDSITEKGKLKRIHADVPNSEKTLAFSKELTDILNAGANGDLLFSCIKATLSTSGYKVEKKTESVAS